MDEAPLLRGQIRLGDVILDLSSAEIERDGVRQRLPEQAFEVLELLVERPGALIRREELIARLWPKTTYIDTDAGLNTAVKKLRAALGDDADRPRYVETIPRRGYRLIVPVQPVAAPRDKAGPSVALLGAGVAEPENAAGQAPRTRRWLIGTLMAAAGALLVAWFAGSIFWSRTPSAPRTDAAKVPSGNVAVLPFLNLTGDARQDHLALGFAESVLNELAQLRGINVIAHTSSFALRRDVDIREIGRRLNARYVLEGSLQGSAARMRITTQLIDSTNGTHLWSKSFDRPAEDIFAVQDEIAREVATALRLGVADSERMPLRSSGTRNLDAWLAFQQGRELAATRRGANLDAAVASFESAVKLDSQFARAYVELADAHLLRYQYSTPRGPGAALRGKRQAADDASGAVSRALAIDPNLGDALIVRGHVASLVDDYDRAEADYRAGLVLSPNSARGHQLLGELLVDQRGREEEGLAMIERARLLDPLEPRGPYYEGIVALLRGDAGQAERLFLSALELRSDYAPALGRLSWLNWGRGQFAEAVKYGERAARADPWSGWIGDILIASYREIGEIESARRLLLPEWSDRLDAAGIRFFDGDYRAAAALVYAEPDRADLCDSSVTPYVLLEHARVTKEYTRTGRFLRQHAGRIGESATVTLRADPPVVGPGAEQAATVLAQLIAFSGDRAHARRLLQTTLAQLDHAVLPLSGKCVNVNRTRARALALLGRGAEAIDALERAMMRDNAWYHGWYLFDRDPAYASVHTDPKFQALRAAYRARIDAEQQKLAELRAAGLVAARR
jgi:TolB-like protein/DNA-binding winged helix-turn-helix (wHTH) protein/tetratricopeptide (TPR) repeat protein